VRDIFTSPQLVFYSHRFDNLMILTRENLFMLATIEGSNRRKMLTHFEFAIMEYELELIGEF
jgi:hypothetical protein